MSSILASQVETTEVSNESKSQLKDTIAELATMFTMYAVTATIIVLAGLQWAA